MTDEQKVRASYPDARIIVAPEFPYRRTIDSPKAGLMGDGLSAMEAWSAALAFTEARLEECRQLREEIAWIESFSAYAEHSIYGPVRERILARLESILAERQSGLKPQCSSPTE